MLKRNHITYCILLCFIIGSCNYSKYLTANEELLWKNTIELEDGGSVDYDAESILKQKPNNTFLGTRPSLGIYNWGNGTDSSFFGKVGNPPVVFDSMKTEISRQQLQNYYFNKGYFNATCHFETKRDKKKEKVKVNYQVKRGTQYTIDSIYYQVYSNGLLPLIEKHKSESEIKIGSYYDSEVLSNERKRLRDIFRNNGYYNFSANSIGFEVDTLAPQKTGSLFLKMTIINPLEKSGDSTIARPHKKYTIADVIISPDYSFLGNYKPNDTLGFLDYKIAFDTLNYKPRYLTDAIHFKPNEIYKHRKVKETYAHLASYNSFQVSEITFQAINDSSKQNQLVALIRLSPRDKWTFGVNTELTNTSANYGVNSGVSLINRNLFKGGEALRLDLSGGLEYQPTLGNSQNLSRTFELGGELSINFPRFLLPFNTIGLVPKRMLPTSSTSLYTNFITRAEFDRQTFGGKLSYNWKENQLKSHQIKLINLSYSLIENEDPNFIAELDPIQQLAFQDEFTSSTSWSFTFSNQAVAKNYHFFNSDLEVSGTLLSLFGEETESESLDQVFNAPIYQFAKLETDYRYYLNFGKEKAWVQRLLLGYVHAYGNSRFENEESVIRLPPFSRFFFLGGSNDLRAWPAYRAGGGQERVTNYTSTSADSNGFAIGTLKALASSEYRFPIYSYLKGAIFIDAGNIWLTGGLENNIDVDGFKLSKILDDLYLGTGIGLRLDLSYFVIRFDTGLKLRDPGYLSSNQQWVITSQPILPNLTFNIALGYPF